MNPKSLPSSSVKEFYGSCSIDFFKDVGEVVHVRLVINQEAKPIGYGYVEFTSANEAKMALVKKHGEYLHDRKIFLRVPTRCHQPKFCIDHNVWYEDCLPGETPPDFAEEVLFVANLSPQTKISHIKDFFNSVGVVESVRLIVNHEGKHVGCGFVEFLSANEAKKALENKNGEYLHGHKIFLMKGHGETPNFVEEARKKTLFVTNLPSEAKISRIIYFFKDVGEVVRVRLIVDHRSKLVGCGGFVEFASANQAEKALEEKNGKNLCYLQFFHNKIFLDVAEKAPYLLPPKSNFAEKLWYEDNLQREPNLKKQEEISQGFCGKKITFSYDD